MNIYVGLWGRLFLGDVQGTWIAEEESDGMGRQECEYGVVQSEGDDHGNKENGCDYFCCCCC
jgi:hypothetical protein